MESYGSDIHRGFSIKKGSLNGWSLPNPKVCAEHYAARAAACRHRHVWYRQSSRATAHYVAPRYPFWSPFTLGGSIRGGVFYHPPIPGVYCMLLCMLLYAIVYAIVYDIVCYYLC